MIRPEFKFCTTLCPHAHSSWAEDFLSRAKRKLHISEVKLVLALTAILFVVALSEVVHHRLADTFSHHFVCAHEEWGENKVFTYLCAIFIEACHLVIEQSSGQILWVFEVA